MKRDMDLARDEGRAKQAGGFRLDLLRALANGMITTKVEQYTAVQLEL